jgi:hypothetical protein
MFDISEIKYLPLHLNSQNPGFTPMLSVKKDAFQLT